MRCYKCDKQMKYFDRMHFNEYEIPGWKCSCGEIYYEPEQAQRILLLNKLKKESIKVRLGRIRSNLILYLPKDVENALLLQKGKDVLIKVEGNTLRISPII